MKKVFVVCQLKDIKLHESKLKRCQIVGFRARESERKEDMFYKQNLEIYPKGAGEIEFDGEKNELILKFHLKTGDFLAIGDEEGMSKKEVLPKK